MKNRKKIAIRTAGKLIPLAAVIILCSLFSKEKNILFVGNVIITVLIIMRAKYSFFSLKALLILYVLVAIFWQYNFGDSYGILEISEYKIDYHMANTLPLIYLSIIYIFISCSNVLEQERKKIVDFYDRKVSRLSVYVLGTIAMASAFIAFPSVITGGARFDSLLPGNAWNHLVVIALLLLFPTLRENTYTKIAYIFCILWFVLQGERVDMIGLLFGMIIMVVAKRKIIISKNVIKKNLKYVLLLMLIIISAVYVGEKRAGVKEISVSDMFRKIVVQNTASDIGYVYNLSIKYRRSGEQLNGKTYIHYFEELLPFGDDCDSASKLLDNKYGTPGGIYILSEPYMNYGIWGIVAFSIIELLILSLILYTKNAYAAALYVYILCTAFRTSWYGLSYIETGMIYILPFFMIVLHFTNGKRDLRNG